MITLIQYNPDTHFSYQDLSPEKAAALVKEDFVNWIDIEISEQSVVEETAKLFNIHHLIAEDIVNIDQLPKFELFEKHLFFNTKMLSFDEEKGEMIEEHLSIVIGKNIVITFQEGLPGDAFNELRKRITLSKGSIRKYGEDYLLYHILDAVVDNYLLIMERFRNRIDDLEARTLSDTKFDVMGQVIDIKNDISIIRKYALPMRDALNKMRVDAGVFIKSSSINYFQDIVDHLQFLISSFETAREMLKDLMDLHHSNQNNEMNRVMKTLTVISAIFIPLTFVAGIYGMNFHYMPELDSKWGYPLTIATMVLVAMLMAIFMKLKKWF